MKRLTLSSSKYPGLQMTVPDIPGAPEGVGGGYTFSCGLTYEVSDRTSEAVRRNFNAFPDRVRRSYVLDIEDLQPLELPDAAVASPMQPPNKPEEGEEPDDLGRISDSVDLTESDNDLIAVEVGKLLGKTIAQAEPLLVGVATNDQLPVGVRRAYLEAVLDHDAVQKGLKERALELSDDL